MGSFSARRGCVVATLAALVPLAAACASVQGGSSSSGPAVVPASPVASAVSNLTGPGPSVPPQSSAARRACQAVHGSFARDQNWSVTPVPAYRLYECDDVPYLASDGSIYNITLRYNRGLALVPQNTGADVSQSQCEHAIYPQADSNPGPGIWNAELGICGPTASQLRNDE